MTVNIERLVNVLAHAKLANDQPDDETPGWNQGTWGVVYTDVPDDLRTAVPVYGISIERSALLLAELGLEMDPETGMPAASASCGTAMCIAGWADHLYGVPLKVGSVRQNGDRLEWIAHYTIGNKDPGMAAMEILEVPPAPTDDEGDTVGDDRIYDYDGGLHLFGASNDWDDVIEYASVLAEMSIEDLEALVNDRYDELVEQHNEKILGTKRS